MKGKPTSDQYEKMQRFAELTKTFMINGNRSRLSRCLNIADELFSKNSGALNCALANVYLYSLSSFMELH